MARTTDQPSAAIRPNTARLQLDADRSGPFDGPDQRGESGRLGDNAERRETLTAVRDEQDKGRGFGDNPDERTPRNGDAEQGSRREQWPTPSAGLGAFAPVLEAWKQVFKSWSELTETMMKAQQEAFADMLSAAGTTANKTNIGELDRR